VVLGIEHHNFEDILENHKLSRAVLLDTDLIAQDWEDVVEQYLELVADQLKKPFPQDQIEQLWGAISAVFAAG
jgi:pyruvate,orthophosphate dikinase